MLWQRKRLTPCEMKMRRVHANLANSQFTTFRQSIVSLSEPATGDSTYGLEILNRPVLGEEFTSVEEFYSFGASHGQTKTLDTYTLKLGLQRLASGAPASLRGTGTSRVFVNVHLSTLFTREWELVVRDLPFPLTSIVLELSEREGLNTYSAEDVEVMVRQLQKHGVRIAVDDIGMGYSGLHTLVMVRPDYVKVDRQLVSGIDEDLYRQHMMKALVEYWRREGVQMIAEGIERRAEAEFFKEIGTQYGQGYWFHRPEQIVEVMEVVKS